MATGSTANCNPGSQAASAARNSSRKSGKNSANGTGLALITAHHDPAITRHQNLAEQIYARRAVHWANPAMPS
jgi:hypothetical protein